MIPVKQQPEPTGADGFDFDKEVRQKGKKCLEDNGVKKNAKSVPKGFWRDNSFWQGECLKQLWKKYSGVCAYSCIYMDFTLGAHTCDHFVPKSKSPWNAYEWGNFRLSCLGENRKKGTKCQIMDPFKIKENTFFIDFTNGKIFPNPELSVSETELANQTIRSLDLDSQEFRKMRCDHFMFVCLDADAVAVDIVLSNKKKYPDYGELLDEIAREIEEKTSRHSLGNCLKEKSPFVYHEAVRQGLLLPSSLTADCAKSRSGGK